MLTFIINKSQSKACHIKMTHYMTFWKIKVKVSYVINKKLLKMS